MLEHGVDWTSSGWVIIMNKSKATSIHAQYLQVANSDVGVHNTCINDLIQSIALELGNSYSPKPVTIESIALK